jgi:hypothetical protein
MIEFYRSEHCEGCEAVAEALRDMRLAHQTILVTEGESRDTHPGGGALPVLVDEGKVYEGRDAVMQRLEELEGFKEQWEKFQVDACYCEEDGQTA